MLKISLQFILKFTECYHCCHLIDGPHTPPSPDCRDNLHGYPKPQRKFHRHLIHNFRNQSKAKPTDLRPRISCQNFKKEICQLYHSHISRNWFMKWINQLMRQFEFHCYEEKEIYPRGKLKLSIFITECILHEYT